MESWGRIKIQWNKQSEKCAGEAEVAEGRHELKRSELKIQAIAKV